MYAVAGHRIKAVNCKLGGGQQRSRHLSSYLQAQPGDGRVEREARQQPLSGARHPRRGTHRLGRVHLLKDVCVERSAAG